MFTGIVSALGRVMKTTRVAGNGKRTAGLALTIRAPYKGLRRGESIAVNGACLTVERVVKGGFTVHAVETTLGRTLFGEYAAGRPVNLERAVRAIDRLGGHIVQGHVDGVGEIVDPALDLRVRMPRELLRYVVEKGSIAVDGVSLTVVDVLDDGFTVALIPHTAAVTTLGIKGPGDRVNLEVDVTVKYVERLLTWNAGAPSAPAAEER